MTRINRETTTKLVGVSPAEIVILRHLHQSKVGAEVVESAVFDKDVPYGPAEVNRLRAKYKKKVLDELWPGINKSLPQTFEEVGVKLAGLPEPEPVKVPEPEAPAEEVKKPAKKAPATTQSKLV
jgi:hypothetical protein